MTIDVPGLDKRTLVAPKQGVPTAPSTPANQPTGTSCSVELKPRHMPVGGALGII